MHMYQAWVCSYRTVVTKGRGAGFLDEPQKLDRFLDAVFEKCNLEISIKTRIGMEDPEEFETILPIHNLQASLLCIRNLPHYL